MDNNFWKPTTQVNIDEIEKELIILDEEEELRKNFVKLMLDDGERRSSLKDPCSSLNRDQILIVTQPQPKAELKEEDYFDNIFWRPVNDDCIVEELL